MGRTASARCLLWSFDFAEIEAAVKVPLLHIADPTGERIRAAGIRRVGLLDTTTLHAEAAVEEALGGA